MSKQGTLHRVLHGDQVEFTFSLAATAADALVAQLSEAGQGRITWLDNDEFSP